MNSTMTDEDIRLKLLAGLPIEIKGMGLLTLPTLKEIIKMNESLYSTYIGYLLFSRNSLNENNEQLKEFGDFEILMSLLHYQPTFREIFVNALAMIFNQKPNLLETNSLIYFGDLNEDSILTEEKFMYIQNIIKIATYYTYNKDDEYNPANEQAKRLIEMLRKNKSKKPKKVQKQNLHSLISALAWKSNGIDKVLDLNIYQLYDGIQRSESIEHYNFVMTGIYAGTVDGKKINLPDINWTNVLKNK